MPVPDVAPPAGPDVARTSASPDTSPARNIAVATPFRVCTSTGSMRPSVVVKRTCVPFWTGVPPGSNTVALTCVLPPVGSTSAEAVSVTVDSLGAVSGTVSQAMVRRPARPRARAPAAGVSR